MHGSLSALSAAMAAVSSIRLLVVAGSPPDNSFTLASCCSTAAQPPGPGLPAQPPSVWIVTVFNLYANRPGKFFRLAGAKCNAAGFGSDHRCGRRGGLGRSQIGAALGHCGEEFVAFAQAAHADILVLEHRFDDAQNRLR